MDEKIETEDDSSLKTTGSDTLKLRLIFESLNVSQKKTRHAKTKKNLFHVYFLTENKISLKKSKKKEVHSILNCAHLN